MPNADFTISQGLGWNEDRRYFESDTFLGSGIKMEAINSLTSYGWMIGLDPSSWDTKFVELGFSGNSGDVEVTLIGEWTPNNDCFPNDNGVDTVSKTFHIVSDWHSSPVFGEYQGYSESKPDELFNILIEHSVSFAWVKNLPNSCHINDDELSISITYKHFIMPDYVAYPICPLPKGFGSLADDNKTLTIEYEIWDPATSTKVSDKFIGTKI